MENTKLETKELNDYKVRLMQLKEELKYYRLMNNISGAGITFGLFSTVYSHFANEEAQIPFALLTLVAVYTKLLLSKEIEEKEYEYNLREELINTKSNKIKTLGM